MGLILDSVTRTFGSQRALDDVNLHVRSGDCYGFIGHNGAGKTTAMRVALGLLSANSGRVIVDGFDAARYPLEARARMGGLIEVPGFHDRWSGPANLGILARLEGLGRAAARSEVERLLELVGLGDVGKKPVHAYSHGMRQRLGLAQALMGRPAFVLLDEPTNGLDPEGIAEMRAVLQRLVKEEGVSVLLSSHQLHEVASLCNRIGVLRKGKLLLEEETSKLLGAASGRYRLETSRVDAATETLASLGLETFVRDGAVNVDLGERAPGDVARALVERGIDLAAFAPRSPGLEEIYLRCDENTTNGSTSVDVGPPRERRVPVLPWLVPIWRMFRYDVTRLGARARVFLTMLVPVVLGTIALLTRKHGDAQSQEEVEAAQTFSTTEVMAFEAMGVFLDAALWVSGVILCLLCSQSIAGEHARGTLRNALLRPVRRFQVGIGKMLSAVGMAALMYAFTCAAAFAVSAWLFDFGDVSELLPNGQKFPLVEAEKIWPELWKALRLSFLPLVAWCGVGFLIGSVVRSSVGAMVGALVAALGLELGRASARSWGFEEYLPSPYLPSPLGSNTSYVDFYADVAQGISNAALKYPEELITEVPSWWLASTFVLSLLFITRRDVP